VFRITAYLVIVIIILSALFVSACAERAPTPAPIPLPATMSVPSPALPTVEDVNFRFLISDNVNAIDEFDHVYVTISEIGVQSGGESGNWTVFTPDITEPVDLKPLVGENALEIWSGNLTHGAYSKVFIYVREVNVIFTTAMGGGKKTIKLPSGKLHILKPFVISENTTTSFVYDVTVVKTGKSGQYILKPQIAQSGASQEFKEVKTKEGKGEKPRKPVVTEEVEVEKSETQEEEVALEDAIWVLEKFGDPENLIDLLDDTEITIEFVSTKGTAKGSAGCNNYFVSYEVEGNQLSILGPIRVTATYCKEPEGVMDQEQDYLKILRNAETYDIEDGQLHILGGDIFSGNKVLIFELE
jgi:heat shock protein HslJ